MPYDIHRRALFAKGLKTARKQSSLSAQDAATMLTTAGLLCSRGTLLAWERGIGLTTREPFASDLALIAKVYGCTVDAFFAVDNGPLAERKGQSNGENDPGEAPDRAGGQIVTGGELTPDGE